MADRFPKIEDIIDGLSTDLVQRRFSRVDPKENEVVRYVKQDSPIGFQVGLEQDDNPDEEPEFNHLYLALSYDLPNGIQQHIGEKLIPGGDLMHTFFRNSPIFHQSLCFNKDRFQDGRINLVYHIGFEKDKTTENGMRTVLREAIDYFCNYVTANTQMLDRTQALEG